MTPVTLRHGEDVVAVEELPGGRRRVTAHRLGAPSSTSLRCTTAYSLGLLDHLLEVKGWRYLCDEIARDEDPAYVALSLRYCLWDYANPSAFDRARLLDFGCGSGASTAILGRLMPTTQIVGVDMDQRLLTVAQARARHHRLPNVSFIASPSGDALPPALGRFGFILLSGVYEHLLPHERTRLLPDLWEKLEDGGVLFISQTPHRFFPLEYHTTGLPGLNFVSDETALRFARKYSRRVSPDASWAELLRAGIRGATVSEIVGILRGIEGSRAELLRDRRLTLRDVVRLWQEATEDDRRVSIKQVLKLLFKASSRVTGSHFVPGANIAIQKTRL